MTQQTNDQAIVFMYYWRLVANQDLPLPESEYEFNLPNSKHRFDFAWPIYKLAVEVDGGRWKPGGGRHGSDEDNDKCNIATSQGWLVFHFSPEILKRKPDYCIEQVARTLVGKMYPSQVRTDWRENA